MGDLRPLFFGSFGMGGQKVMRNFSFGLMAVLVVIALAVFFAASSSANQTERTRGH
jgi:hypothetical protein